MLEMQEQFPVRPEIQSINIPPLRRVTSYWVPAYAGTTRLLYYTQYPSYQAPEQVRGKLEYSGIQYEYSVCKRTYY